MFLSSRKQEISNKTKNRKEEYKGTPSHLFNNRTFTLKDFKKNDKKQDKMNNTKNRGTGLKDSQVVCHLSFCRLEFQSNLRKR